MLNKLGNWTKYLNLQLIGKDMPLQINDTAPDFTLLSSNGTEFNLYNQLETRPVILYFYPKDFTPGCTRESCDFRDTYHNFLNKGVDVFGISRDSLESHQEFITHYQLPFQLLSDPRGEVAALYKSSIPILGLTLRITYLIGTDKKVRAVKDSLFDASTHIKTMIGTID